MSFVICARCGEKAELPADAPSTATADAREVRCQKCQLDELLNLNAPSPPAPAAPALREVVATTATDAEHGGPTAPVQAAVRRESIDDLNWDLPSEVESGDVVAVPVESPLVAAAPVETPLVATPLVEPQKADLLHTSPSAPVGSDDVPTAAFPRAAPVPVEPVIPGSTTLAAVSNSDAPPSDTLPSAYSLDPALRAIGEGALVPPNVPSIPNARATLPFGPGLAAEPSAPAPVPPPPLLTEDRPAPSVVVERAAEKPAESTGAPNTTPEAAVPRAAPAEFAASLAASDAPVVHSWSPAPAPSPLRRWAPVAAALGAVLLAFIAGTKYGRMTSAPSSPVTSTTLAAAATPTATTAAGNAEPVNINEPAPKANRQTLTDAKEASESAAPLPSASATPPAKGPRFNPKLAQGALSVAAARAKACRKAGTPAGTAVAMVTFAPSGQVENVAVTGGKLAGTEAATCIADALGRAHVPAFVGAAQTIKQTVKLK